MSDEKVIHLGKNDPLCVERGAHVRTEIVDDATCLACFRVALSGARAVIAEIENLDPSDAGPAGEWNVSSALERWWEADEVAEFGEWLITEAGERAYETSLRALASAGYLAITPDLQTSLRAKFGLSS